MERRTLKTLLLGDVDMGCCKDPSGAQKSLSEITLFDTNFSSIVLDSFDLVVYKGKLGTKILKGNFFGTGILT